MRSCKPFLRQRAFVPSSRFQPVLKIRFLHLWPFARLSWICRIPSRGEEFRRAGMIVNVPIEPQLAVDICRPIVLLAGQKAARRWFYVGT